MTTRRQEALAKTAASLGDALSSGGVQFKPICPTPAGGFALPSLEEGRDAIWCLFELMFRFELIMLDNHFRVFLAENGVSLGEYSPRVGMF